MSDEADESRRKFGARLDEVGVRSCRFIDVRDGEKGTRTSGHQHASNWLNADDSRLSGNYGVHPGYCLIEFDVDDYDDEHDTTELDALPETFTVESPHTSDDSPGHRYYAVEDDEEVCEVLKDVTGKLNPEPTWGEVKYAGKYVVGPGSQLDGCTKEWCDECEQPDGGYYRIAEDRPIATLTAEQVSDVLHADPEFSEDQGEMVDTKRDATDVFDLDPEDDVNGADEGGEEWMTVELAEEALDEMDPDMGRNDWAAVGFALSNHFGTGRGGRLFRDWSRSGSKWDHEAERQADDIISDATKYPHDISTFVRAAKEQGWDTSAAARKAASDGGVVVATGGSTNRDGGGREGYEWATVRELYRSEENGATAEANQMAAKQLLDEFDLVTVEESDGIWRYDPDSGIYREDARARLRKRLADGLGPAYSRSRVTDILHRLRSETFEQREGLTAPEDMICVANGVLDLSDPSDPTLFPHSHEYLFTWRLEATYDPDAEATTFKEFLGDVIRPADLPKLQQYAGTALRHWKQPRNLLAIVGPTDAGKGVFLRVLKAVFGGADNVASESLYSLAQTRWGAAQLYRRPINITNELSTGTLKNPNEVKKLAGEGDQVTAEFKGEDKFEYVPTAKHLFATNQVPQVEGGDDAFYNRWLFATFPTTVPPNERDPTLTDRIIESEKELAGVLNWLLDGYADFHEQGGFSGERTIAEKEDMWSAYGDSVDRFIDKCIDDDATDEAIPKGDAYEAYKAMCNDVGLPAEKKGTLTKRLKTIGGVADGKPRGVDAVTTGSNRPHCYTGVTLTGRGQEYLDQVAREQGEDGDGEGRDGDLSGY